MRHRLRLAVIALAALLASRSAGADPTGRYFYVAPYAGLTVFDPSFKVGPVPLSDRPDFGARAGWQWKPWLAFEGTAGYTPTRQDFNVGAIDVDYLHGGAGVTFTPFDGRAGGPFLHVGAEIAQVKPTGFESQTQQNLAAAFGLRFWLGDRFGLRTEARDLIEDFSDALTHTISFTGGLIVTIGATPRDTDQDGVPDSKDKCPSTLVGARVDPTGCPIDSDGDGVFDGIDACEATPKGATVDMKGCPLDPDGDGVADGLDQCADTPRGATVDVRGCPADADSDAVLDGIDKCPGTPRGASVDSTGCPNDGDGDGVADGIDKCPETPKDLRVDPTGCSIEVIERETEMLDTGMIRLQDVTFETGKAVLAPESEQRLDIVGHMLRQWPDLKIEIGGHTDSRGSDKANLKLSQARVEAVRVYLLQRFPDLKPDQFTTKGYGESQPVVPNSSPLNMSKNRRVEFKVMNTDVLRKEIERRRLLPK